MKAQRKELQTKFHRDLIVDAAERLFAVNGYEKTIMDEVAKEAGYSKSTMYVYFKSKDEIYNYIILRGMNLLKKRFEEAINCDKTFEDRYYDLCFALSRFQEEYPLHFDGILGNISVEFNLNDETDVLYQIYIAGEEINAVIGKFFTESAEAGIIRKNIKFYETIFTFWASVSGIVKLAAQKTAYIQKQMKNSKSEFLRYSFSLLFESIREHGND